MSRPSLLGLLAFTIVSMSSSLSCGDSNFGPFPDLKVPLNTAPPPALNDPIPYETLGQGTLVFERIGPSGGGAYVLDMAQKRSWGLYVGYRMWEPAVSPDGKVIAYGMRPSPRTPQNIYTVNVDGTGQQRLSDLPGDEYCPSWSYDGKYVFFPAYRPASSPDKAPLYRQSPVPDPTDRVLIRDFWKMDPLIDIAGPVSASVTGKVVFRGNGIRTINSDGSGLNLIFPPLVSGQRGGLYSPAWSPDGQTIAMLSVLWDSTKISSVAVILYRVDGSLPDTLITLPASGTSEPQSNNSHSLCWSPDGSQIAFTRPDGVNAESHVFVIKKDGSGLTQVTSAPGVSDVSLSWGR